MSALTDYLRARLARHHEPEPIAPMSTVELSWLREGVERVSIDLIGRTDAGHRVSVTISWWLDGSHATVVADGTDSHGVWVIGGHHDESRALPDWLRAEADRWLPKLQALASQP